MNSDTDNLENIYESIGGPIRGSLPGPDEPENEADKAYQRLSELPDPAIHGKLLSKLETHKMLGAMMMYYMSSRVADHFEDFATEKIDNNLSPDGTELEELPEQTADEMIQEFQRYHHRWTDTIDDAEEVFIDIIKNIAHRELPSYIANNHDIFKGLKYNVANADQIVDKAHIDYRGAGEMDDFDI